MTKEKENIDLPDDEVCGTCGGIGYVRTMESVYPGEPHMAPVGEEPCPDCNGKDEDDFSGASEGDR